MKDAELGEVQTVLQPWGKEEVFANVEGRFLGRVLHVRAGQQLTLQLHLQNEGVISLMSGAVLLELGEDADSHNRIHMTPGQTVHIQAGMVHRISAVQDSMLLEVASTAHPA